MSVETELRGALTGNGAVAALVGTRVYPVVLPQNPTLPAIVYQELRTGTVVASDGDTGLREGRWQLSLWGAGWDFSGVGGVAGRGGGGGERVRGGSGAAGGHRCDAGRLRPGDALVAAGGGGCGP